METKMRNQAYKILLFSIAVLSSLYCISQQRFTEVSAQAGINHQFIVFEGTFGGGAAAADFNNDGYEDIFIAGGKADDALYINNKNGTFTNIYPTSGLKTKVKYITQGAVCADVNKDGWIDIYVTNITTDSIKEIPRAPNRLFINNHNSTFTDATENFKIGGYQSFSTGAVFGDINADGYPDLFVGNYFKEYTGELNILNDAIIVGSNQMAKPYLFLNVDGKYFKDVSDKYGITYKGFGFGGVFSDFDNDSDIDLLINNDFGYKSTPNLLLQNEYPKKALVDVANKYGMALRINAMGTAVGDFNNDGFIDYFVTNIRENKFMVNQGPGKQFINKSKELGTAVNRLRNGFGRYTPISWGANFADFDNDGDLDLFVANGCLNPNVEPNPNSYFENVGAAFTERAKEKGLADLGIGRGSIYLDYDNDGDLDLLVVNQKPISSSFNDATMTRLFRNDSVSGNWIKVSLRGIEADFNGIGSRIEVVSGKQRWIREIDGGSSHESQNSMIAHFGIGNSKSVDSIIVKWIGGKEQVILNQKINSLIKVVEAGSRKKNFSVVKIITMGFIILLLLTFFVKKTKKTQGIN